MRSRLVHAGGVRNDKFLARASFVDQRRVQESWICALVWCVGTTRPHLDLLVPRSILQPSTRTCHPPNTLSGPIAPRVSAGDSPLSVQTRLARQQGFGVVVQWGGPHGSVDRWQSWGESRPRVIVRLPHFHSRRTILGPALLSSHPSVLGSAHGFYIRHFGDNIQCR